MLSLDLFATQFEKELREGAVDDLEYRRMNDLREKMEMLMQAYKKADTDEVKAAIMKRYKEYKAEREGYMKVREQQVPSKQDPFAYVKPEPKGIGDIQDPKAKMAQLAQRSKKGPLANVGAGLKAFIKGEPEPMGEQQELGRRGIGMANMKALQATVEKGFARTIFQFPTGKYVVGEDETDKMADYYNALDSAGRTNFVYNMLGDGAKFVQMCRELGIQAVPVEPQQPELPGMPQASPQGQLPLSEKKKSSSDDLETGDVKVARELQKLRAQYPAAKSDVEAVARAEIDSTERSQQQLAAIRGANEKQDALLKQLVALDQEQGREINTLDKENDSLEKQLDQVQSTNAALAQTVSQMTGTKKSARPAPQTTTVQPARATIDLIPGAPADQQKVVPMRKPDIKPDEKTAAPKDKLPNIKTTQEVPTNVLKFRKYDPPEQLIKAQKVSGSDINIEEHGGGIGPKKHWQSMMPEGQPQELIHRYLAIDAENDVDAVRAAIQAISKDPALSVTSKSRLLGQIGMIIKRHRLPLGRAYYQFMQQYMEDINETALNPKDLKGDYEAKRRALHDLSLNKEVDQAAVLQRRLDLDREAKAKGLAETVTNVKAGMGEIYRRLAPKIERHRDSFLAGQLYDELENYAELHGAEGEFKRMMSTARNRAHMEYDTNPGGFQNWFWFLPFEDNDMTEGTDDLKKKMSKLEALALAANRAGDDAKCKMYQQKIQSLKQKLSQSMAEGWSDQGNPTAYSVYIDGREWRAYKSDEHARAVAEKVRANLKKQGRDQTVTIAPSKVKRVQENISREPRTARERDEMIDKIRRMMTQDRNPANLQIMKKDIEILQTKYRDLKEDSDSGEAVEMAIMRRMLVAHTDLIVEFGLDKVVEAIEEVAYDVGDTDEIGSSDVSGWVRQVERILGVEA
jgi:hypothetical protein